MTCLRRRLTAAFLFALCPLTASAQAETVYTGDIIQGKRVVSQLDVGDLEAGKKHSLLFQGVQTGTGQYWYVPVVVAKGINPGKRILLVSGVHGDETSPVDAMRRTMEQLDPAAMSGTVTAVYDVSRPAKEGVTRMWPVAQWGGFKIDLNRVWPGNEDGGNAPTRHAGLVFNKLLKPNADYALDYHTAATGTDFTAFIFAKMSLPEVKAMAELFPIEQIKNDPGYGGTLETALIKAGIPCLTIEIGGPRYFDKRMIPMFVEGALNVFKLHGVIGGPMGRTAQDAGTFFGDALHTVRATAGGYVELLVDLRSKVAAGQSVAIQRNAFGEVVQEYKTEVAGEVAILQRDAVTEPGTRIVEVLYDSSEKACDPDGCPIPEVDYAE
ncbi:MAG: succinylglutamate desuccinylase/aspartoacylase family protein [Aestuariivirga sp.]|uniref:M14 family metallopeptidase n=1 Tax=Aestuariivirga sp. TaxID=2650926 RepID=UPI0025BD8ACD|nr:succinylglutamate desuccinylase/aspartoacylase family protein [Aestuariivirga sp.]MCA3561455.1 succinylglutamate desuccinylase/aspartoacylase family protein [Aestuariivirga sp.]